jgi:hypothetical protein
LEDNYQGTPPRTRERREKDKKTMLSRALQKANTAVLLDNAQNFEGAVEAYEDACKLLQQVMIRSSQPEDKNKLDAIVSHHRRSGRHWLLQSCWSMLTQAANNIHESHKGASPIRIWLHERHRQVSAGAAHEW